MGNLKSFTLITAESAGRKLGKYLALGITGLAMWFGGELIYNWRENKSLEYKIAAEKNAGIEAFNNAIKMGEHDGASEIFSYLKMRKTEEKGLLEEMEKRVYSISENGLYERIIASGMNEKEILAQKYLSIYPNKEHRKDVIRELINSRKAVFLSSLKEKEGCDEVLKRLALLRTTIEEYSKESGLSFIATEDFVKEIKKYIEIQEKEPYGLEPGCRVKIEPSPKNWNSKYYEERTKNIPPDLIGEVVGLVKRGNAKGKYAIRFSELETDIQWTKEWDNNSFGAFINMGWNVAWFHKDEIKPIYIDEAKKGKLGEELEKLASYLEKK